MSGLLTTAVGSYPKPDYLVKARNQFRKKQISREQLEELERQATREWIEFQDQVGLDILVDGEQYRGDMVEYFAEEWNGYAISGLVRSYGNRYYHKPIIVGKVGRKGPTTVRWWQYAQGLTKKPVKGMLTGPYTLMDWSFDEYYGSRRKACLALAEVVHQEARDLARAGAQYIQIDEPAIHTRPEEELDLAIEAMARVVKGIDREFHTHICYGEVELIYPDMLRLPVKQIHLAFKNTNFKYLKLIEQHPFDNGKELGVGVVDAHSHLVEPVDEVKEGIRKTLKLMPPERVWVEPDCGLKTRTVDEAKAKLKVMTQATREVKQELGVN